MEDPEENPFGPPPDASGLTGSTEDASPSGDKKQRQPSSEMGPAKKKARTTTIELKGVPSDGRWRNHQGRPRLWRIPELLVVGAFPRGDAAAFPARGAPSWSELLLF